ncbi:non-structural maintenance of chromosomes element 1 homolog [Erpetoichthys calabaricus]|uniref:Non-structural maintenance of chromosomes element 1 homolog n=1 Tax=Erpetoichthys calabaricus TaxID=27687 RepID=A0A8C4SK81_ERPCA|nr:non-structural maintenance of chromosomes element 1 homolog [Erpetoichthys calabaricus]
MPKDLTESHRRFLQEMMQCGIMDVSKCNSLYKKCCEIHKANYIPDKLDDFVNEINTHLQPMFMHIRCGMSEEDGQQYYALVNLADTEITRMATDYSDNELELFRKAMDLILDSDNGLASSTDILNLADTVQTKKMKKKDAEQVLQRLVQNKWLCEKNGEYSLSTRCIIEMEPYIRNVYQDSVCNICHNVAVQSQMCENSLCGIRMHFPCVARVFRGQPEPHCPACKDFWPHEIPELNISHSQLPAPSQPGPSNEKTSRYGRPRR